MGRRDGFTWKKNKRKQDHFSVKLHSKQTKERGAKRQWQGKVSIIKGHLHSIEKIMDYYQTLTTLRTRRYNVGRVVIKSRGPGILPG